MRDPVVRKTGRGGGAVELPALIVGAGDRAARSFVEFFTVHIRNQNTRTADARAAGAATKSPTETI